MKYLYGNDKFKTLLIENGINGTWSEENGRLQLKTEDRGVINLFSNGTIQFQGKIEAKNELERKVCILLEGDPITNTESKDSSSHVEGNLSIDKSKKVFVVYGHDDVAREQLELILLKLGLDPFVLSNTSGSGNTIIEALEDEMLSPDKNCEFGIVLMTPDDMGYAISEGESKIEPRARQNVVLEMGMLLSALKRERVVILKKGHLESPSDTHGIIYLPFNNHIKEIVPKLV